MSWLSRSIANTLKLDDDHHQNDAAQSSSPRGVKEDLSELTKTLSRQFWGVASFLAPPPQPIQVEPDPDEGIRSDFAEIGGRFKSGISAVSEITKIASNFLQFGADSKIDEVGNVVGVTHDVVAFARDVAMHPNTWLHFPLPDHHHFDEFDMSDAQQEHALAVERLTPRLAALRMELCPEYMSEGCFWTIYFVLVHPKLSKEDVELLSTPEILEARSMLSAQNRAQGQSEQNKHDSPQSVSVTPAIFDESAELEMEKHPVQSMEMQIVDKAMVEEQPVKQTTHQPSSSSISSSKFVEDKFEADADDWLKEDEMETVGTSRSEVPIGNDEDISFSDLEEDDDDADVPSSYKKVTSGSDASTKGSRDWVQLSESSSDSVKDINTVISKHDGSEQVSARNSESKDSNDWLNVDDIDTM